MKKALFFLLTAITVAACSSNTVQGVKKDAVIGAEKTSEVVQKGGEAVGKALHKGGEAVEGALQKGGEVVGSALKKGGEAVQKVVE